MTLFIELTLIDRRPKISIYKWVNRGLLGEFIVEKVTQIIGFGDLEIRNSFTLPRLATKGQITMTDFTEWWNKLLSKNRDFPHNNPHNIYSAKMGETNMTW